MKTCSRCRELKDNFWPDKKASDWLRSECKDCRKKEYYNNREKLLKYKRDKYWEDPDKMRERTKRYLKTEIWRENSRLNWAKRRALKKSTWDWSVDILSTTKMLDEQWWVCNYCWLDILDRAVRHLDHIIPLSKWWTHTIDNVQWLCAKCNMSKSDKILE